LFDWVIEGFRDLVIGSLLIDDQRIHLGIALSRAPAPEIDLPYRGSKQSLNAPVINRPMIG